MKWISVTERLPGLSGEYIVCKDGFVFAAEFVRINSKGIWSGKFEDELRNVTHWMPMPDAPKSK